MKPFEEIEVERLAIRSEFDRLKKLDPVFMTRKELRQMDRDFDKLLRRINLWNHAVLEYAMEQEVELLEASAQLKEVRARLGYID